MAEERAQRRLAAILAADVVGYSRLMQLDEAGTLTSLKARLKEVLQPLISEHHGRIVKVMGDGVLVEFASAVDAVECAVQLQKAMAAANADTPEDRHIVLRVGINLGDVMVESNDLYGDGVNIAARLEVLADPGSVYISDTVFSHVRGKVHLGFEDLGERNLKNIAEPVRVYRVSPAPSPPTTATLKMSTQPRKPSIAALPFSNMNVDPDQQYLCDGITEDIITELSRYRDLMVIARNSSFQYRDKSMDMKRVARELGVEYLVEGSIRNAAGRIRVTAQLIEAENGSHIWAQRYERELKDVFAIQDEVAQTIAASLVGQVERTHAGKARRRPTESWAAYDCYLQAIECNNRYDTEGSLTLLNRAIQIDSQYAQAYAMLAFALLFKYFADYDDQTLSSAVSSAERALSIDPNDALSHAVMGAVQTFLSNWDVAGMHLETAVSFNPNSVSCARWYAHFLLRTGHSQEALKTSRLGT